jgi:hypothetical protein
VPVCPGSSKQTRPDADTPGMIWPEPRLPVAAKSAFHHSNDDEHDDGQHDEAENPRGTKHPQLRTLFWTARTADGGGLGGRPADPGGYDTPSDASHESGPCAMSLMCRPPLSADRQQLVWPFVSTHSHVARSGPELQASHPLELNSE